MSWRMALAALALSTMQAAAQPASGSLTGTVVDYLGTPVADAPIRAVNASIGTDVRTYTDANGRYELEDLRAGTYIVSITMPCCAFVPYLNDAVVLEAGRAHELDIQLAEGGSLNVLGDDPATLNVELRSRQVIPDAPAPRTADGKPDLSGVWLITGDPFPEPAEALPWAEEISRQRIADDFSDHPHTRCLPNQAYSNSGATPFMSKFVQTSDLLVILFENVPGFRQAFLDGRDHPANPNPSWMGHSIGHWDGDTLVIDTVGFNSRGWTETYPRTEMLRLEERFTRTTYGSMNVRVTIEDPGVFVKPWVINLRFDLAPQEELIEFVCENNKWDTEGEQ